jgi:hypothetical protein
MRIPASSAAEFPAHQLEERIEPSVLLPFFRVFSHYEHRDGYWYIIVMHQE